MTSTGQMVRTKSTIRSVNKPLSSFKFEVNNNIKPEKSTSKDGRKRLHSLPASLSQRKQQYPQHATVEDDDEEVMSNMSDSEEEDPNTLFTYKPTPTGDADKCDWCTATSTHRELTLVTHDRHTKSFCSDSCQQLYKNNILNKKICEWCRQHFPSEPSLIVVEPSMESVPLQFCSQSCINNYKMELFCAEVKEQLRRIKEDNVQLPNLVPSKSSRSEKKILITPELWSKGESTLVFVDDFGVKETESNHNSSKLMQQEPSDRKRRGTKMESVISKLSRRQYPRSDYEGEVEIGGQLHSNVTTEEGKRDTQIVPINLTTYQAPALRTDHSTLSHTGAVDSTTMHKSDDKTVPPTHKPMIVPVPMFIPVPIPIPIPTCLTALSQAMTNKNNGIKQETTITATHRTDTTNPPLSEKRYVLKRQPTYDAPE